MKLNPDCIRDILLTAEEVITPTKKMSCYPNDHYDRLNKYTYDEIIYHINQCEVENLIIVKRYIDGGIVIKDLSPSGHALLAKIRSDNAWNKLKSSLISIGTFSLKAILENAFKKVPMFCLYFSLFFIIFEKNYPCY